MKFLASWFGNPIEYWPNIVGLMVLGAVGVFILRKIQAKNKSQK